MFLTQPTFLSQYFNNQMLFLSPTPSVKDMRNSVKSIQFSVEYIVRFITVCHYSLLAQKNFTAPSFI